MMHRSALLLTALISTPAFSETFEGSIGQVSLESNRVDVPLYDSPSGQRLPMVQVQVGEEFFLFSLSSSSNVVTLSETIASHLKLATDKKKNRKLINLKGKEGAYKVGGLMDYAHLPSMKIGGLFLQDLNMATTNPDKSRAAHDGYGPTSDVIVAGTIGLDALPADISWAISPSTGLVSFVRGNAVTELQSDGVTVPYTTADAEIVRYGKHTSLLRLAHRTLIVESEVGGVALRAALEVDRQHGMLFSDSGDIQSSAINATGNVDRLYVNSGITGTNLGESWMSSLHRPSDHPAPVDGWIGSDVLGDYDIVVNRQEKTVTLTPASAQKREDPLPFMIAQAESVVQVEESPADETSAETEEAEAGTEEAEAETGETDISGPPPGTAGDWIALADLYVAAGNTEAAIDARRKSTQFDEKDCTAWLGLGQLELEAGQVADAIVSLEKASGQYHAWFDMDLESRTEVKKEQEKLTDQEKKTARHYVASGSCHKADGVLAAATFSAGDLQTVQSLYRERFDLDADLAQIAGNAMITMGAFDEAQEPLRQSLKLGIGQKENTRLALALVYANNGDWDSASALFDRALSSHTGPMAVQLWLENMQKLNGREAALEAAQAFVKNNPESSGAIYGLARIASGLEEEESKEAVKAIGDAFFAEQTVRFPRQGSLWGAYARYLTVWGEHDAAQIAAEQALMLSPDAADAWLAMADVHAARGDTQRARTMKIRAAQSNPLHPGYAQLFNTIGN